jgi:hypothetical protein
MGFHHGSRISFHPMFADIQADILSASVTLKPTVDINCAKQDKKVTPVQAKTDTIPISWL